MFAYNKVFSSWSVNDLASARDFYEKKLGLPVKETPEGLSMTLGPGQNIFIYPKPNHEPATFTVFNFGVKSVEEAVDQLTSAGILFLHYDEPMKTDKKGIWRGGGPVIAWFSDPAGNILSVVENPRV